MIAKPPGIDEKDLRAETIKERLYGVNMYLPKKTKEGMYDKEVMKMAEEWWTNIGCKIFKEQGLNKKVNYDSLTDDVVILSGILLGQPWFMLKPEEQMSVARARYRTWKQEQMNALEDDRVKEEAKLTARINKLLKN